MWKAFEELEQLGWLNTKAKTGTPKAGTGAEATRKRHPKMIAVQASGCAPIVKAFQEDELTAVPWKNAQTIADGLRVPHPFADHLILRAIRESGGTAVATLIHTGSGSKYPNLVQAEFPVLDPNDPDLSAKVN